MAFPCSAMGLSAVYDYGFPDHTHIPFMICRTNNQGLKSACTLFFTVLNILFSFFKPSTFLGLPGIFSTYKIYVVFDRKIFTVLY